MIVKLNDVVPGNTHTLTIERAISHRAVYVKVHGTNGEMIRVEVDKAELAAALRAFT